MGTQETSEKVPRLQSDVCAAFGSLSAENGNLDAAEQNADRYHQDCQRQDGILPGDSDSEQNPEQQPQLEGVHLDHRAEEIGQPPAEVV